MQIDTEKEVNHGLEQAKAQMASIKEMVEILEATEDDETAREKAETTIQEDPLSVEVRSDWVGDGSPLTPAEYNILLSYGGPAVRIIGELDDNFEPETARLEYQDWGTPWTEYREADEVALLAYARCFYFADRA